MILSCQQKKPIKVTSPTGVDDLLPTKMRSGSCGNKAFFEGKDPVLDMMSKLTIITQQRSSEEGQYSLSSYSSSNLAILKS